jgi:hypothetical protein
MTVKTVAVIALATLAAISSASAQSVGTQHSLPDLTGLYRCVSNCVGAGQARIVQHGWELHLTNEAGASVEAWIDRPGHINSHFWSECAVYSPEGFTIQFNSGAVWVLLQPVPGGGWKQW